MAKNEGDGSYQKLIANIYGIGKTNLVIVIDAGYKEQNKDINVDEPARQLLFSFARSGLYYYTTGARVYSTSNGYYWTSKSGSGVGATYLVLHSKYLSPQGSNVRGYGYSFRWGAKFYFTPVLSELF